MIFHETALAGAYSIELKRIEDKRGFFARSFCETEFGSRGLASRVAQCNVSFNAAAGTLRGMHFQIAPFAEAKLIRVTRGAIYDVIVDLRPNSPTKLQWIAVELSEDNGRLLYVPGRFSRTDFKRCKTRPKSFIQMFESFHPECARGLRWDDPALKITWPDAERRIILQKDRDYPLLAERPNEDPLQ